MNRLSTNLSVRFISKQISCEFLLKICMREELIVVLIDQKAIAQTWLQ